MTKHIVDVAPTLKEQKYMVVFEVSYGENKNTATIYAESLEKAYLIMSNAGKFFEMEKEIQKVSLVGIYKRISIKVVEEGE